MAKAKRSKVSGPRKIKVVGYERKFSGKLPGRDDKGRFKKPKKGSTQTAQQKLF